MQTEIKPVVIGTLRTVSKELGTHLDNIREKFSAGFASQLSPASELQRFSEKYLIFKDTAGA